jgi:hypothetical protein
MPPLVIAWKRCSSIAGQATRRLAGGSRIHNDSLESAESGTCTRAASRLCNLEDTGAGVLRLTEPTFGEKIQIAADPA